VNYLPEFDAGIEESIKNQQSIDFINSSINSNIKNRKKDQAISTCELYKYDPLTGEITKGRENSKVSTFKINCDTHVKLRNIRHNTDLNAIEKFPLKGKKIRNEKKDVFNLKKEGNIYNKKRSIESVSPKKVIQTNTKGLTLKEAIAKVCEWRYLSNPEKKGKDGMKITKEMAAEQIGMKKKSLDDYLMFLRLGIALKYDFKSNMNNSFHSLRQLIKKSKPRPHWKKGIFKDVDFLIDL